ncbi:hypothetical protein [Acinetobacter modestus]|uniref:hypothetical protein n=1 Tax=Acinetobacter modestus TaxID=1776740 RepID=UPI001D0ED79F|nr:hypothetical protein [Acinetobacter modestus]
MDSEKMIALMSVALNNRKIFYDGDKSDIDEYCGLRIFCGKWGLKVFSIDIEALK